MTAKQTNRSSGLRKLLSFTVAAAFVVASGTASAAATITITNANAAGVGFNDPTPVAPIGGNPGTTLGQQRLNAFAFAANIWANTLSSTVTININAQFTALTCTAASAVLGSAGATEVDANFPGALVANAFYPIALVNKLDGVDEDPGVPQINANFNSNLGLNPNCLPGSPFYLGFDDNFGSGIDLVTVLLHEFGHGFGFQTFTSGSTGNFLGNLLPSIWDFNLLDNTTNKTWNIMTAAERRASAINTEHLVWTGAGVTAAVPSVLADGTPELRITAPSTVLNSYLVGTATFGPSLTAAGVSAEIITVVDQTNGTGLACNPLSAAAAASVAGKIALVDRGVCTFNVKAATVQAAGAIGVIIADNVAGSPPPGLGGIDNTVTIPAVRITQADGVTLKQQLANHTRGRTAGIIGKMDLNPAIRAGADASNRALMYTPNPFIGGSSVSHWDTTAFPNQLMEPNINLDLTHAVTVPVDLTFRLLQDIGW
jgi:hypothetical protein